MRSFYGVHLALLLSLVYLASCVTNDVVFPFDRSGRVWPDAPETARIAYIGEFSDAEDLGIERGFWSRFVTLTTGPTSDAMVRPMAVAATNDGRLIFVADPEAHCVHRFDLDKGRYTRISVSRGSPAAFPVGLALTDDGWLYVTDSQHGLLYSVAPGDNHFEAFSTSRTFRQPTGIVWNPQTNHLLVTDTTEQTVTVIDRSGVLQQSIGGRGGDGGSFNYPTYLTWSPHNELLVTDSLNFRLQRFDSEGRFIHQFGENGAEPGYFSRPKGVATDTFGHIYVVDALMHAMQIFSRQGELLLFIGQQGQGVGEFWLPNGIYITRDNTIYVADSYNKRVQVFRYVGPQE